MCVFKVICIRAACDWAQWFNHLHSSNVVSYEYAFGYLACIGTVVQSCQGGNFAQVQIEIIDVACE